MTVDLYQPGHSVIHCLSPGLKVLVLAVVGTGLFLIRDLAVVALGTAAIVLLYRVAGLSLRFAWRQLKPVMWLLLALLLVQTLMVDWLSGVFVFLRFAAVLLLAGLITLTTRSSDMIDSLQAHLAWLRPLGLPSRPIGLALALAFRFIPVLGAITAEVREAQRVRGLDHSVLAVALPVTVRLMKMADDIADAIDARCYDPGHSGTVSPPRLPSAADGSPRSDREARP